MELREFLLTVDRYRLGPTGELDNWTDWDVESVELRIGYEDGSFVVGPANGELSKDYILVPLIDLLRLVTSVDERDPRDSGLREVITTENPEPR